MHYPNDTTFTDLDLDRIAEGLRRHLKDVTAALAAIDQIREWVNPQQVAGSTTVASHGGTIRPSTFSVSQPLAANIYAIMRQTGRPMTSVELEAALRACGVTSRSEDFQNTLCSVMTKKKELFSRVAPKTWALVEWEGKIPNPAPTPVAANIIPLKGTPGSHIAASMGLLQ